MKKKVTIALGIAFAVAIFLTFQGNSNFVMSYDGGAPSGYAGDPAGGSKNCTQCHGGSTSAVIGWITSDIPVSGYLPNTTYQITATSTGTGGNKGFSISPQSASGSFLGTLTAGTGTSLNGTNHYVRSSQSNITTNPKVWTFSWTSPATGLGPVTFYGAFAIGTGTTKTTTYTVSESTTGVAESSCNEIFTVFPNPVNNFININYDLLVSSKVVVNLYDLEGRKIVCLMDSSQLSGAHSENISINRDLFATGTYVIELKINDISTVQKIIFE